MNNKYKKPVELTQDCLEKAAGGAGADVGSVVNLQSLIHTLREYPGETTLKIWSNTNNSKKYAREQCDLLVAPYIQQRHRQFTVEQIRQAAWPLWLQAINSVV